jgi:hypothetical protein
MFIQKVKTFSFDDNDIYVLEECSAKIIINSNYDGLFIIDWGKDSIQQLQIKDDLVIYYVYKSFDKECLLLYCPDDKQMIFIDREKKDHYIFSLSDIDEKVIFSPAYYWFGHSALIAAYNGQLYQFDFVSWQINKISYEAVEMEHPYFVNFVEKMQHYRIVTIYSDSLSFIFEKDEYEIGYYVSKNDTFVHMGHSFTNGWHAIESNGFVFVFVHENKLEIIDRLEQKIVIEAEMPYSFLKVRFVAENIIAVLKSNKSDQRESIIELYSISA